ncbi:uncharacterized protein J4E84_010313 [Alternaria hordeiaustralica]|uniref:uncharacterized protein n=1 Tax=Alternaria hordeiaustralica TaxID=1187925 RepID=UPI0020C31DBC|nr:uncharacterized protein J4E84_010313 [Alternaria hordeiaustralica]KAI4674872.1 hypothetical protein J4E84_010313 [Alternaria hordeiaustralica]
MAAPTNNLALRQDDGVTRCKVEAQASHTYGGGSYYQTPVDITSGTLYCYDVNNDMVYYDHDADVENFNGATSTVSAGDCHTLGDVTFHTAYNSASNHFEICSVNYNGADTQGVVTSSIDPGPVMGMLA